MPFFAAGLASPSRASATFAPGDRSGPQIGRWACVQVLEQAYYQGISVRIWLQSFLVGRDQMVLHRICQQAEARQFLSVSGALSLKKCIAPRVGLT